MPKSLRVTCDTKLRIPLDELHELQGELKEMTKDRYGKFKKLVEKKGVWFACHVWKEKTKWWIIDGHGRKRMFLRLRDEGYAIPDIPCVEIEASSMKEAKEAVLAASSNFQRATGQGLYEFMVGAEFEPSVLDEYDLPDIDADAFKAEFFEDGEDDGASDDVPPPPITAKSKRGELWLLGSHRLLIDDCTVKENVERLMGGERADMVFTDPPYNHASGNDLVASPVRQAMQRLKDSQWDKHFSFSIVLPILDSALAEDCTIYICTSWHLAGQIWDYFATRSNHSSYCVWQKPNPMPSLMKRHWTWSSELICYATRGKHTFNFPPEGHAPNVWMFNKSQKNDLHPTMKPVALVEHAINHSSKPGFLILDLFGGSGSTLIACESNGRNCRMAEIDPIYGDVILTRWAQFTGLDPKREDGASWAEINAA